MNTFFTYYARKNHSNITTPTGPAFLDYIYKRDYFYRRLMSKLESIEQTPAPKYLILADYEYNPDLIEVK